MERDICFAIAGGAKAVSAKEAQGCHAGSQQRSGGAEKTQGPPQADNYNFSLFLFSAHEVTNSS